MEKVSCFTFLDVTIIDELKWTPVGSPVGFHFLLTAIYNPHVTLSYTGAGSAHVSQLGCLRLDLKLQLMSLVSVLSHSPKTLKKKVCVCIQYVCAHALGPTINTL